MTLILRLIDAPTVGGGKAFDDAAHGGLLKERLRRV